MANIIALVEMTQKLSLVNLAKIYKEIINNNDLNKAKKLRLIDIKKY